MIRWLLISFLATSCCRAQLYLDNLPANHSAIGYLDANVNDPAARLANAHLEFRSDGTGYLASLLEYFGINPDSQGLVFSKSSLQAEKISPRNPRAIYFNDEVAVGYVRGSSSMEIAAIDPARGPIFYTFIADAGRPVLRRSEMCLHCHQGPSTLGVPGIFIGSVFPNAEGTPARGGAIVTDHRTSFADRWGGWYVNAAHGEQADRANAVAPNPAAPEELQKLTMRFSPAGYLSTTSDIVALMTFEHQTQMTNFITRAGWKARMGGSVDSDLQALVRYMLFTDEALFREPIEGVSSFTKTFPSRGPRDSQGRSLRDFDLKTRLFRYPLSYMIYSRAFDALPGPIRTEIYRRLRDRLTGQPDILAIVRETKKDLPDFW
jgi:hypothetical protein